ncbi:MAG: hypothetical protein ACREV6_19530 [Clostridium sp.]|uniref:hypothetical protein n=1 Tax=Clostridium sp. TaxID=1506 RepID=UPI003D6D1605
MNKIQLEKILKEYKTKKSIVDITKARIQAYTEAIDNPELISSWGYSINSRELGMPGAPLRNTSSTVEKEVCESLLTIEIIREWIAEDKNRIYKCNLQINIIEGALNGLTEQERYIIGLKYFEKMNWSNIEMNFNNQFKHKNEITSGQVRNINNQAIGNLLQIITPLKSTFN